MIFLKFTMKIYVCRQKFVKVVMFYTNASTIFINNLKIHETIIFFLENNPLNLSRDCLLNIVK